MDTSAGPCDSPAVVNRSIRPIEQSASPPQAAWQLRASLGCFRHHRKLGLLEWAAQGRLALPDLAQEQPLHEPRPPAAPDLARGRAELPLASIAEGGRRRKLQRLRDALGAARRGSSKGCAASNSRPQVRRRCGDGKPTALNREAIVRRASPNACGKLVGSESSRARASRRGASRRPRPPELRRARAALIRPGSAIRPARSARGGRAGRVVGSFDHQPVDALAAGIEHIVRTVWR